MIFYHSLVFCIHIYQRLACVNFLAWSWDCLRYSHDEPEYTPDMLISINPDYAGLDEKGAIGLRLPPRGLEAAYSHDEPEYTLDDLIRSKSRLYSKKYKETSPK